MKSKKKKKKVARGLEGHLNVLPGGPEFLATSLDACLMIPVRHDLIKP